MSRLIALAAILLAFAAPARAADTDACQRYRVGDMAMSLDDEDASVPITVAGRHVTMMIDTGGAYSMLTEDVVAALGLKKNSVDRDEVTIWGGAQVHSYVTTRDIELGGLKRSEMNFLVMPNGHLAPGVGGMLAPDVLHYYDVEFDFAGGRFSLLSTEHCDGKKVYWAKSWSEIDFSLNNDNHIIMPVTMDGHALTATLDTGASRSTMSLELAESLLGFDASSPLLKRIETEDGSPVYRYPITALSFGGVTVANPDIDLVPDSVSHVWTDGRVLLGLGLVRQLHLYISYREKKLYVTAAGARD